MEGLLKIVISDKKSMSGDSFILVLLSPALISRSVISFILMISVTCVREWLYSFLRFIMEKRVGLCFPLNGYPQIS